MFDTIRIQIAQRGLITLPKEWREAYNMQPGDELTMLDLGGVFVLAPRRSQVDELADRISYELAGRGESLESMLLTLREIRERYGEES